MNLRRSTTSNMTETVLQYNSMMKDVGNNWRPSWPPVISNESISMLGMCGPNPGFSSAGCYGTAQAVPRLVQPGKCLATPNFMTSPGPVHQGSGGVACSGPTTQREYLALPKSLPADVRSGDSFMHGTSSSGLQLPFLNLQAADRGLPSMDPGFLQGHSSLACLPSSATGRDYGFHRQEEDLESNSVMNLQTINGDFGQLLSWDHTSEDSAADDGWFNDIDGGAFHGDASGLVHSSRGSGFRVSRNDHSSPGSLRPGSYSSGTSQPTQSNMSATNCKRQRVSWESPCDPSALDQQPIILDDDMEAIAATGRTCGSSAMVQRMSDCQLQLPAESSTGNKTTARESRLRINRGHNISNIEPVRGNATCLASGNSPRSVLAVESNLQGDVQDVPHLPPSAEMIRQQHVNMWSVQSGRTRHDVYQPCANSQLSQTSDGAFVALPQEACAPALDIVSSSTEDSASIMTQQRQLNTCADVDAKTASSSRMRKLDVDASGSSYLDSVPGVNVAGGGNVGGDESQHQPKLPNLSSLGISGCDGSPVKGEILSGPAGASRTCGSQVFSTDRPSMAWSANNFGSGGVSCQSMPTLDSLSSSIHGWVASASHTNNRLQEGGPKVVATGTWESKFSNSDFMGPIGQAAPTVVHENDQNLRKRLSEDSMDPACKRLKEGSSKESGVVATAKTGSGATSHKSLGPALNTNLKPRARQGSANDPQSIAARHRRERISERLKKLQDLVPNGSKVDLVTMLEKAISYVKSLQLQVKFLTADEYWPGAERGFSPDVQGVSMEVAARMMMAEGLAAVETESSSIPKGDRHDASSGDESFGGR